MSQIPLQGRGFFEHDPYFNEAREEVANLARKMKFMPDNHNNNCGVSYLLQALAHWQNCKWNMQTAVHSIKDDNTLETVFSFLPDHLSIIINGIDLALNGGHFEINKSNDNNGFTLVADQTQYIKNSLFGKIAAGRRRITRRYRILVPYDWNMMQGAISKEGMIYLKVPYFQQIHIQQCSL